MTDDDAASRTAIERDMAIDEHLGTTTPRLASLEARMYESYSVERWGLEQFAVLADEEQRAIASDLLLSACEGVKVNLRELALAVVDVAKFVGPNGRTMPGPDTTFDELLDAKRLHRACTDSMRAFGSTLDCLDRMECSVRPWR